MRGVQQNRSCSREKGQDVTLADVAIDAGLFAAC
jgi:hypothetical protein